MEGTPLTRTEIDDACRLLVEKISAKYPHYSPHMYFLYNYGVRIGEVFSNHISISSDGNFLIISPQKGNTDRHYEILSEECAKQLQNLQLSQHHTWLNVRNLQRILKEENTYSSISKGKKNINAHIFRHNFIKKQIANGKQYTTINSELGYTTATIVGNYDQSIIEYN